MAMTAEVKDELSRLAVNSVSARRAEVASLLRFHRIIGAVDEQWLDRQERDRIRDRRMADAPRALAHGELTTRRGSAGC